MLTPTKYIGVLGTWGWPSGEHEQWWFSSSPLARYLAAFNIAPAKPEDPFKWSGDLEGVPILAGGRDWEAGGEALKWYLEGLPYKDRNLIAHSHGGQVAFYAARQIAVRSLILVGTPVRKQIEQEVAPAAMANIGVCRHLYDPRFDLMGWAGALFDGRVSTRRHFQVPDLTAEPVDGMGHSGVLTNPVFFPLWAARGWLDILRGAWSPAASGDAA